MTRNEYNGWTNYETWLVGLWLDNDEGLYATMQEQAEQFVRTDGKDDAASGMADWIKEFIEEQNPLPDSGLFTDLLTAALSEVNWYEVAEHYTSEVELEQEEADEPA